MMTETPRPFPETTDADLAAIDDSNRRSKEMRDLAARTRSAAYAERDPNRRRLLHAEAAGYDADVCGIRAEACERAAKRYEGFRAGDSAEAYGEWYRQEERRHRRKSRRFKAAAE